MASDGEKEFDNEGIKEKIISHGTYNGIKIPRDTPRVGEESK